MMLSLKIAMWKVEILQLWSLNLQLLLHYQRLNPVHILMCTYRMVWCANIASLKNLNVEVKRDQLVVSFYFLDRFSGHLTIHQS